MRAEKGAASGGEAAPFFRTNVKRMDIKLQQQFSDGRTKRTRVRLSLDYAAFAIPDVSFREILWLCVGLGFGDMQGRNIQLDHFAAWAIYIAIRFAMLAAILLLVLRPYKITSRTSPAPSAKAKQTRRKAPA